MSSAEERIAKYMAGDRKGSLILSGCTSLTSLPQGLRVGEWLDLFGCTGLAHLRVGIDFRGYEFYGIRMVDGPRVVAGCRNFTPDQARKHWATNPELLALAEAAITLAEGAA